MKRVFVSLFIGALVMNLAGTVTVLQAAEEATTTESVASEDTTSKDVEDLEIPEFVKITSLDGNKEKVEIEVPYNPQRIAVLDFAVLDILDRLGMGDRVVGSAQTPIDYLEMYSNDETVANLGTIKEADMEAVMECEPDVIFIGGRLAGSYEALSEIAPVVYLSTDMEIGLLESMKGNVTAIASLFGLEEKAAEEMEVFDERITALQEIGTGKTALIGMVTSGSFNLLGNGSRCSLIGNELGFDNLTKDEENAREGGGNRNGNTAADKENAGAGRENADNGSKASGAGSTHGNEASFEIVVDQNPEYIFVLDRDRAIGTEGVQLAQEVMENELIKGTDAYAENKIVYLEHPSIWYTAEGGIRALDIMLQDLETALLQNA